MGRIRKGMTKREEDILSFLARNEHNIKATSVYFHVSVQAIYKVINKLKKEGYLIKENSGLIKKVERIGSQMELNHNYDILELHKVEVRIICLKDNILMIKSSVMNQKDKFNTRVNDHTKSVFFNIGIMTYMITNQNYLYGIFPEGMIFTGNDIPEQYKALDLEYRKQALLLEKEFNIVFWKKGRNNYEVIDRHQALSNNGISRELRHDKISNEVKVYDKEDGKTAYLFDFSGNKFHAESPHSSKADNYIYLAKRLMESVRDRKLVVFDQYYPKFQEFFKDYDKFKAEHELLKESSLMYLEEMQDKNKPNYIG